MKRKMDLLEIALLVFMVLIAVFTGVTAYYNRILFFFEAPVALIAIIFGVWRLISARHDSRRFLEYVGGRLGAVQSDALIRFPMPVAVIDGENRFIWSNTFFHEEILKNREIFGLKADDVLEGFDLEKAFLPEGNTVKYCGGTYCIFATESSPEGETLRALYFIDKSLEATTTEKYEKTRPVVMSIVLDNLDDLFANCKESEKSIIIAAIENMFEFFARQNNALIKRCQSSKYIMVTEQQYLDSIIAERFSILDKARKITTSQNNPVTLSIGVAGGEYSLEKLLSFSEAALEMALGRGGDQAAVHTQGGYEFYGGYAAGVEKKTKVKTRVVAAALSDLINASSGVMVMGHRFGDLDCIGAAAALCEASRTLGKESNVIVNSDTCLAKPLLEKYEKAGELDLFISPETAAERMDDRTLLIIVDTHIRGILESPDIYSKAKNVVVIDHHRRMIGAIDNAVIFYHEPHASSASEMVTELVQYFDSEKYKLGKNEAEALMSGIMLDTKSFSMRCGVRTFEAAAYLRKCGADTVSVKKLFRGSLESYTHRSKIVSAAKIYKGCAISCFIGEFDDIALVAPQAADELLTINGAEASVVMFTTPTGISFCARSLGGMNVQIIMEALGGGGHQTMAGAQIPDITAKDAYQKLVDAIDDYFEKARGHSDDITENKSN